MATRSEAPVYLAPHDVTTMLDCYGLRSPPSQEVSGPAAAGRAAIGLGDRVALKAVAPGLLHKSDAGGVRVGLAPGQVARAAREMTDRLTEAGFPPEAFLVQAMARAGVELIVGVVQDPAFGPLIACGAGGTSAELLQDVAVRLTPLSDLDAREMLTRCGCFRCSRATAVRTRRRGRSRGTAPARLAGRQQTPCGSLGARRVQ